MRLKRVKRTCPSERHVPFYTRLWISDTLRLQRLCTPERWPWSSCFEGQWIDLGHGSWSIHMLVHKSLCNVGWSCRWVEKRNRERPSVILLPLFWPQNLRCPRVPNLNWTFQAPPGPYEVFVKAFR